ncbi:MAG: DUF2254 domain-containing protein [Alphaproteobacteria bacterium]|nr:DUF2254 domain-containing protein [Alphaproteobacteria bacterium]
MEWQRRYSLRSYLRSSLWVGPVAAYIICFMLVRALSRFDDWLKWSWNWTLTVENVDNTLNILIAGILSFIVFTFGSLLIAIQVASAQLTPRVIATTLLRDNTIRFVVSLFVLSFTFDLGVAARTQQEVPYFLVTVALLLSITSIAAFVYLIDHAARLLRPVTIVWRLGEAGLAVIEQLYPSAIQGEHTSSPPLPALGVAAREVPHDGKAAIIVAIHLEAIKAEAFRLGGIIELVPRIGDFVAMGEPLFNLYGGAAMADERFLRSFVAMGTERTIEQDATFAFRIVVDIAIKALSQAINDPTTAVLALDQLHRLLRAAGKRHLHDDAIHDSAGNLRVIFRTPNWEEFVQLSCREIRLYGAANFQIARRLRAMLQDLLRVLPEARAPALHEELQLLDETLEKMKLLPGDLKLARTPDLQGLGASLRT